MNQMRNSLEALRQWIPLADSSAKGVSAAPVGWHIAHSFLVAERIAGALASSDPARYRWQPAIKRRLFLAIGKLPRGKARAPKAVMPPAGCTTAELEQACERTLQALQGLETLPARAHFTHPMFGMLSKQATIRFITIHTRHHIRIIQDILQAGR